MWLAASWKLVISSMVVIICGCRVSNTHRCVYFISMTALHSSASSESLFSQNLRHAIIFSKIHNETVTGTMYLMISPIICSNCCHFTFNFFFLLHFSILFYWVRKRISAVRIGHSKKFEIQGLKFAIQRLERNFFLISKIKNWILKIKVGRG